MRLGIMSDIHGNSVALDAVLADAATVGVDRWWALGDLVAMGPDPAGVVDRLQDLRHVELVGGNTERYLLTMDRPDPTPDDVARDPRGTFDRVVEVSSSFAWTRGVLHHHGALAWLRALPSRVDVVLGDGTSMLGVHATLHADDGIGITPDTPDAELRRGFAGSDAAIVVGGHTHHVTDRWLDGVRMLNGGSVGNPTGRAVATYLVVSGDESGHQVDQRTVAYDVDRVIREITASGIPGGRFLLDRYYAR